MQGAITALIFIIYVLHAILLVQCPTMLMFECVGRREKCVDQLLILVAIFPAKLFQPISSKL